MSFLLVRVYDAFERTGVTWISSAGLVSLFAIFILLVAAKPKNAYPRTHVIAYYFSLLAANAVQSSGTVMNLRWVLKGQIDAGTFCSLQGACARLGTPPTNQPRSHGTVLCYSGGIKQAGNVATAIWCVFLFHVRHH